MDRKFCDWCNYDITHRNKHKFEGNSVSFAPNGQQASANDIVVDLDLCTGCFESLDKFFKSKRGNKNA